MAVSEQMIRGRHGQKSKEACDGNAALASKVGYVTACPRNGDFFQGEKGKWE